MKQTESRKANVYQADFCVRQFKLVKEGFGDPKRVFSKPEIRRLSLVAWDQSGVAPGVTAAILPEGEPKADAESGAVVEVTASRIVIAGAEVYLPETGTSADSEGS